MYGENNKINNTQDKQLSRDKIKYSFILNNYNINILYLWETDIKKDIQKCELLILEYINNNGILNNYHSFNYEVKNGKLLLCKNIIIPYQDIPKKDYTNIIAS